MKQIRPEFLQMIKSKMETDNIGIRELARKIGVSHPTITEIVTYGNMPSFDTCNSLSNWLGISEELGLRKAGLLKTKQDNNDEWVEEQSKRLSNLTHANRPIMEKFIDILLQEDKPIIPVGKKARAKT